MFLCIGLCAAGVLALYMALIHRPSTGVWTLSCIRGTNLVFGLSDMGVLMAAENGAATRHYLEIENLPPLKPVTFTADSYPLWRKAADWVTPEEREAFLAQPRPSPPRSVTVVFPGNLYYYLGPCAADRLLVQVHAEAVAAHTGTWIRGVIRHTAVMLLQHRYPASFDPLYLPRRERITFHPRLLPGFAEARGGYYTGQVVFEPGIRLYSRLFDRWNLFKWLTPLAILWAAWPRDWFFGAAALILVTTVLTIAVVAHPEPRYYAISAPLYPLLIGGMMAAMMESIPRRRG
jgi:hypothetical protein